MNRELQLLIISSLFFTASAVAGGSGNTHTLFKGGAFDMSGYTHQIVVEPPVVANNTPADIKGGPFDITGYLNRVTETQPVSAAYSKQAAVAKVNMHCNPNLLFVPDTTYKSL